MPERPACLPSAASAGRESRSSRSRETRSRSPAASAARKAISSSSARDKRKRTTALGCGASPFVASRRPELVAQAGDRLAVTVGQRGGERFLEGGAPLRRSVEALAAAERDGLRPFEADVPGAAHTVAAERLRQPPGQARPPASR